MGERFMENLNELFAAFQKTGLVSMGIRLLSAAVILIVGLKLVDLIMKLVTKSNRFGKVDAGGGGTVAQYIANLDMDVIDVGVPVLSMHAPFEVVAKFDVYETYRTMYEFCK